MFYNHEVLTSRKYGIATIWLVATLGSKSGLRKIKRRAIIDVNIFKACEIIVTPEVPMALRLQSNLLYGVARVYDQQCAFVLSEAQTVQNDLKRASRTLSKFELDTETGKAPRPEQLLLQDDPNFMPDLAFTNLELDSGMHNLGLTSDGSSLEDSLSSLHTPYSSQSSNGPLPRIVIPSSHFGAVGQIGDYIPSIDDSGIGRARNLSGDFGGFHDEEGLLDEPGFTFDIHGNLVDNDAIDLAQKAQSVEAAGPTIARRESSLLDLVRAEHEDAMRNVINANNDTKMDFGIPPMEDYTVPINANPFTPRQHPPTATQQLDLNGRLIPPLEQTPYGEESRLSADAVQARKPRMTRVLQPDHEIEVSAVAIKSWETNYLDNMTKALAHRVITRAASLAKKRAEHVVWTMGIGGVGAQLADTNISSPLDIFYGNALFAMITKPLPNHDSRKRDHSSLDGESTESEGRRVRSRPNSADEFGRGNGNVDMEGSGLNAVLDDEDVELGRNAPTPLPGDLSGDPSSMMPWNRSVSQRSAAFPGSAIPFGQNTGPLSRRVSINSATPLHHDPISRRITSASPLVSHGLQYARLSSIVPPGVSSSSFGAGVAGLGTNFDEVAEHEDDIDALNTQEEFELFGPAANVDTQTAGESQWLKKALDHESSNFLDFVKAALTDHDEQSYKVSNGSKATTISFGSLLKPKTNSKVVAAQGLLHCLTLATRNVLLVHQNESFGEIVLSLKVSDM